jgi:hypothetical protein
MMALFEVLDQAYRKGKDVAIEWHYDPENEMGLEYGQEFMEDLSVPFKLIPNS